MAYNEALAERLRLHLRNETDLEEKKMFGGICFMVNGKMCLGIIKDDLMCRIDPDLEDELLQQPSCRPMDFSNRPMKGYVYVDASGYAQAKDLQFWIDQCLAYNPKAKASKKKK